MKIIIDLANSSGVAVIHGTSIELLDNIIYYKNHGVSQYNFWKTRIVQLMSMLKDDGELPNFYIEESFHSRQWSMKSHQDNSDCMDISELERAIFDIDPDIKTFSFVSKQWQDPLAQRLYNIPFTKKFEKLPHNLTPDGLNYFINTPINVIYIPKSYFSKDYKDSKVFSYLAYHDIPEYKEIDEETLDEDQADAYCIAWCVKENLIDYTPRETVSKHRAMSVEARATRKASKTASKFLDWTFFKWTMDGNIISLVPLDKAFLKPGKKVPVGTLNQPAKKELEKAKKLFEIN